MTNVPFPPAVLFDFDGVVVDSFQVHFNAWQSAYFELFEKSKLDFPHKELSGKSPLLIAEYICEQIDQKDKSELYFSTKAAHLHSNTTPPRLLPGVQEIQSFLQDLNIPHGIASNATRSFIKNSISQLELGFSEFLGIEDYTYPKPHPEAYLSLAKKLEIPTDKYPHTWVFEDSVTGTEAAKEAGMFPVGILTVNSKETMESAGSQLVFPSLLEAWKFLKKNA